MPKPCSVCNSIARAEIEAALVAGDFQLDIAERFHVSQSALSRHLNTHMDKLSSYAAKYQIEPMELSGSLEDRLDALLEKAAQILAEAERTASTDTKIRAVAELRKQLELCAKLAGQIADQTATVQLLQVIVTTDGSRDQASDADSEPIELLAGSASHQGTFWRPR